MPPRNRTTTIRVLLSLDPTTDGVLERLAHIGLFGKNKAEVGTAILREWIWTNEEKLSRHGVTLSLVAKPSLGKGARGK
jgi:hypothetical protein